jgi:hypothetical protein
MKRFALLLSLLLICSIFSSSSLSASPPQLIYRVDSGVIFFYQYIFPILKGFRAEKENPSFNDDWSDVILGGDADDTANGKDDLIGEDKDKRDRLQSGRIVSGFRSDGKKIKID